MSKIERTANAIDKGVNRLQTGCWIVFANLFFAAFCLWGVYAGYISWKLQTEGQITTGIVVRLDERDDAEGGCCTYVPVVEFQANDRTFSFEGDTASYPPQYEVGEQVPVIYDPANPDTAQINKLLERWLFPVIIIPAMILTALVVNFFMFRALRRGEAMDDD